MFDSVRSVPAQLPCHEYMFVHALYEYSGAATVHVRTYTRTCICAHAHHIQLLPQSLSKVCILGAVSVKYGVMKESPVWVVGQCQPLQSLEREGLAQLAQLGPVPGDY